MTKSYKCDEEGCTKVHLYLCTIYPDFPSRFMLANLSILQYVDNLHVMPIWIRAGNFRHRLRRHEQDRAQCEIRQMYLDRVPAGEWLLVMDSDEIIFGSIWSIPDVITFANNLESQKIPNYMAIWEMRSDAKFKARPRLIRKVEGLQYGTEHGNWKHDWINIDESVETATDGGLTYRTDGNRNYIEARTNVRDDADSWTLDFLFFAHYKKGIGLSLAYDIKPEFADLPMNYKRLSDFEMVIEDA